jgi:hypothetical protein
LKGVNPVLARVVLSFFFDSQRTEFVNISADKERGHLYLFFVFIVPLRVFTLFLHKPGFHLQMPLIISSR